MDTAVLARWMKRVSEDEDGCWIWSGCTARGYGMAQYEGKAQLIHRVMYEHFVAEIPEGLHLDHTCHTEDTSCLGIGDICKHRSCVNPWHLEPVTRHVNILRGRGITAQNAVKTHCPSGHEYDGGNLYVDRSGRRHCRICMRDARQRHYHSKDGAAAARARRHRRKAALETNGK